ncbi:MAG: type IV pilus biogenesis protein PilM [Thermoanaerobaculia bacterium]
MARSFPPDIVVLDSDSLIHVRLARAKKNPRVISAKTYRLAADTFHGGLVTPDLVNEQSLVDALRRIKVESGGTWDRVSVLIPDSWFRMNLLELPSLPDKPAEALEVVRWSLKRTLPIPPEELRIAKEVLGTTATGVKVIVVSAREKTLAAIERVFGAAGLEVVLIEAVGLNIWNAITVREAPTTNDRLFFFVRDRDFTTAVFRGNQPLFLRSRNLNGERTLGQEVRLSASYLRDSLGSEVFEKCYVAGDVVDAEMLETVRKEFNAPVTRVAANEYADNLPGNAAGIDSAITACTGVFAA